MKTYLLPFAVFLVLFVAIVSSAPAAAESPRDSLVRSKDLSRFTIGATLDKQKRRLVYATGETGVLESRHAFGTLSCDVLPWIAVSVGGGETKVKPVPLHGYGDGESMWMAGVVVSFWEYDLLDPSFLRTRNRLQASISYWEHDTREQYTDLEWEETRAALVLRSECFVEDFGDDLSVYPYSIVFIVGAVHSEIDGVMGMAPGAEIDVGEDKTLGVLLGADVNVSHNVTIGVESRIFEDSTLGVNVGIHF